MITKSQTAELLAVMAAFDRRTIGEADVEAWHLVIADLEPLDCVQAVKDHYAENDSWLMPSHVVARATAMARRREGQRKIAENDARDQAETRALEAAPSEPVDRAELAARLKALAAGSRNTVPKVDRRADSTRMAEARAEIERVRKAQGETA